MPSSCSATSNAAVSLVSKRVERLPKYADSSASSANTFGPDAIQPERSTASEAANSSSPNSGAANAIVI